MRPARQQSVLASATEVVCANEPSHDGDAISVEGIVREALPYAQYRVEIEGPRQVIAHTPGGPGRNFVRVLIGDRVRLELSPLARA